MSVPKASITWDYPAAQLPDVQRFDVWLCDTTSAKRVGTTPLVSTAALPTEANPLTLPLTSYGRYLVSVVPVGAGELEGNPIFVTVALVLPNVLSLKILFQ